MLSGFSWLCLLPRLQLGSSSNVVTAWAFEVAAALLGRHPGPPQLAENFPKENTNTHDPPLEASASPIQKHYEARELSIGSNATAIFRLAWTTSPCPRPSAAVKTPMYWFMLPLSRMLKKNHNFACGSFGCFFLLLLLMGCAPGSFVCFFCCCS